MHTTLKQGKSKPPAIAGSFYPSSANELNEILDNFLERLPHDLAAPIKALIVPHAGLIYSGTIAAKAYALLKSQKENIKRILLIGPSHRDYFNGLALAEYDSFETPLGKLRRSSTLYKSLSALDCVKTNNNAHQLEHCLEVQYPFLQKVDPDFVISPLLFSQTETEEVSQAIEVALSTPDTLVIISSDLSHFHDYRTAQQIDSATCEQIESLNYSAISSKQACGSVAIKGLLKVAKNHQWQIKRLGLCNSGDTAGDKSKVVGYASYAFY